MSVTEQQLQGNSLFCYKECVSEALLVLGF